MSADICEFYINELREMFADDDTPAGDCLRELMKPVLDFCIENLKTKADLTAAQQKIAELELQRDIDKQHRLALTPLQEELSTLRATLSDAQADSRRLEAELEEANQWIDSDPDWKATYNRMMDSKNAAIKRLEAKVYALTGDPQYKPAIDSALTPKEEK